MIEQNRNFIISQRDNLIALFEEWQEEILETALSKDKSELREYLIDFVRFLKERINRIKNFENKPKSKKETFV